MAKSKEQQMELFADGGLMDEGGMVDEESGNEVPAGALREEVRDDIPANLSEGEFVFPADVVRYFGLETLMKMRQEAKAGLARMEAMGQMGNADEATLPDDLPFDINDLDIEDEQGELDFAVGGAVPTPGFTGIGGYTAPPAPTTGFTPYVAPPPVPTAGIQQQTTPQVQYTTAVGTTNLPTFQQTVGGTPGQYDEFKTYVNDAGQTLQIPFKNGQPIYPIPEGYKLKTEDTTQPTEDTTTTPTTVTTQDGGDSGDDFGRGVQTSAGTATVGSIADTIKGLFGGEDTTPRGRSVGDIFATAAEETDAFGGSKEFGFSNEALRNASFDQGKYQAGLIGPISGIGSALAKEAGIMGYNMKDLATAGNQSMNSALNAMGLTNRTQLMNDAQATIVGKAMSAAHAAVKAGKNPEEAVKEILGTQQARDVQRATINSIKDAYAEKVGAKGDFTMADFANEMAKEEAKADKLLADIESGRITDASGKSVGTKVTSKDFKTGLQVPTNVYTSAGIAAKKAATATKNQASVLKDSANNIGGDDTGHKAPSGGYKGNVSEDPGFDGGGGESGPGSNDGDMGSTPGGTYICTASYANGIIPRDHFTSLKKYGIMLRRNDPYLMKAYDWFGPKLAAKVKDTGWTAYLANLATAYYKARYTNTLSAKQKVYDKVTQAFVWPTLRFMGWVLSKVNK